MNDAEEVKARVDIVELVQSYVRLKKSGRNYFGLCPFHTEKTPSFSVSPEHQIFKCFGCDKGGDVISFVQEIESLSFREALQLLADRVGVKLTPLSASARAHSPDTKSLLFRTLELATQLFHTLLVRHASGKEARAYLKNRGVTPETIKTFRLGWVPLRLDIAAVLAKHGIQQGAIRQAGGLDQFKGRIVFPMFDQLGVVVGFSGRILVDGQPKYLNSSDSPIFHKHRTLYGLHLAKRAIREAGYAVVVEGQMDVVMSHQAGFLHTVASSGTALSAEHLQIMHRLVPEVRLAFDADPAGERALHQAAGLAFAQEMGVKVVRIPAGKDAADTLLSDSKSWEGAVETALPFLDDLLDQTFAAHQETSLDAPAKRSMSQVILPWIKRLVEPIERDHYTELFARRLGISGREMREALKNIKPQNSSAPASVSASPVALSIEQQFIGLLIAHPHLLARAVKEIDWPLFKEQLPQQVFKIFQKGYTHMQENLPQALKKTLEPQEATQALSWAFTHGGNAEEAREELLQYISRLTGTQTERIKHDFATKIEAAERLGNRVQVKKLVEQLAHELKH